MLVPAHGSQVIVVRRGWHIDVGFSVADLLPPLRSVAADMPSAHFWLFGFGDMHYLMSKHHGSSSLAAALWPGAGVMLVTGLEGTPQEGFGAAHVVELEVTPAQALALQQGIWKSFLTKAGGAAVYRPGPYEGSFYYIATEHYSALHTCNTWAAESLAWGGLEVHAAGVMFAGQLWSQVRKLQRAQHAAPSLALTSN